VALPELPPVISGLSAIASRYDGFLLDQWGCIHDGVNTFSGVATALNNLRAAGKRVVVLSNAPRRADSVTASMAKLGIGPEYYDAMLSSGEAVWQALSLRDDKWHAALGTRCLHIGPERDRGMLEGNGLTRAHGAADADLILITGPDDDTLGVEQHEELLRACQARGLPMLCANPDLVVVKGAQRLLCAGAVAARYAELGGVVMQYGKPNAGIYDRAMRMLGLTDRKRVLAVGDSFHTDVGGALKAGIDVAFIPGGIHGDALGVHMGEAPSPEKMAEMIRTFGFQPTWVLPELKW
jgi:HAD superfamily hydrolase (TIGR01459 family)